MLSVNELLGRCVWKQSIGTSRGSRRLGPDRAPKSPGPERRLSRKCTYAIDGTGCVLQRRGVIEVWGGRKDDVPPSRDVMDLRSLCSVSGQRLVDREREDGTQRSVDHGCPASWPRLSGLKTTRVSWLSQLSVRALERLRVTLSFVLYVNRYHSSPSAEYLVTWTHGSAMSAPWQAVVVRATAYCRGRPHWR